MKVIKFTVAVFLIVMMNIACIVPAGAAFENIFKENKDNFSTPVENQGSEGDCLYYATLSAAGSYARKYFGLNEKEANFSEANLKKSVGQNYDTHNFGEILYKTVGCDIGDGYFITSVEMLSNRGIRYIQEKVKENGAVVAVIELPEDGGMNNKSYYNDEYHSFFCPEDDLSKDKYHAITIVGWDEDFSWENYSTEPYYEGAWICKNSYGEDYGDGGYFYLSYQQEFVYAASLEVTHMGGLSFVYPQNEMFRYLGYVNGIAVRAFENNINDNITVTVGDKTAFSGEVRLKNGYTLIPFEHPVAAGEISVEGSMISKSSDAVYCYWSLFRHSVPMDIKPVEVDETWIEHVERISIYIDTKNPYARDTYNGDFHNVTYSSIDNCIYITPRDGYRFDENTWVDRIHDLNNFKMGTIAQVTSSFPGVVRFDDGDDGRGRLIITGQRIGGAWITGINIVTDETGMPGFAVLTYDNGSTKVVKPENLNMKLYSDEDCMNEITDISGLEKYYLKVEKLPSNIADEFTVSINGEETTVSISDKGEIIVEITVPNVEDTLAEFLGKMLGFFVKFKNLFKIGNN